MPSETDKRATIREVAALADVSIGTVSRVVAGTTPVSEELSSRVLAAVAALDYRPHGRAQRGPANATRLIAFTVADLANLLYGPVVAAAEERMAQMGYTLLVASTRHELKRERELLGVLQQGWVDGAILSVGEESYPNLGEALRRLGVPAVILDRTPPKGFDAVLVDHREGAASAARYLIGLGHRRIALLTATGHIRPAQERTAGLREAYAEAGLDFGDCVIRTECAMSGVAFAELAALLDGPHRPTAILTLGSQALSGALRAIKTRRLKMPADLSLICFGDTDLAQAYDPQITCVRWDLAAVGQQAVELMMRRISGAFDEAPRIVAIPTELVLRQSCGPPAS